ncbi:MAG: 4Fe-4S binding protein [Lachnospiraceae bacterium]
MTDIVKQKKRDKKLDKKIHRYIRIAIQLLFFFWMPSLFTAAFAGIKYVAGQLGAGELIEPTAFVKVLVMLLLYTMLFGRFFCGYACAFGSLGDGVYALSELVQKRVKRKLPSIPLKVRYKLRYLKFAVLFLILILCFLGIYGNFRGTSPWDVFSKVSVANFELAGYGIGIGILVAILIGMCVQKRFFCRFLCPMGAVFAITPILPFSILKRDRSACINKCTRCIQNCPADLEIQGDSPTSGECFMCGVCIDACPKANLHLTQKVKGNEIWLVLLKAGILLAGCLVLGV